MKFKKIISLVLVLVILCTSIAVFASYSDVPENASYNEALNRLTSLGIIGGYDDNTFRPDSNITREQFAKMIVTAAGLEETANVYMGSTIFPDIDPQGWSSGYINVALDKGYITGMLDGKFHPSENITFAQACTAMVRALGYTDDDVTGQWPRNYIEKAKLLGLVTDEIKLSNNAALPRWAAVVMIDKLMSTKMKGQDKTFADATGLYKDSIILGTSKTMDTLGNNQVMTENGTYYVKNGISNIDPGSRYKLRIVGDTIVSALKVSTPSINATVTSVVDTTISYTDDSASGSMTLPANTVYYYKGAKQNYENLKNILQVNSSVVLFYNKDKTGFDYAAVYDPVYSAPIVVGTSGFDASSKNLSSIGATSSLPIFRNTIDTSYTPEKVKLGERIDFPQIEAGNAVYMISDIWGRNKYIMVIDHKITGDITGVSPNSISPNSITIDNKAYEFSKSFNVKNVSSDYFAIGNQVTLILGYDGKVAEVWDNGNFGKYDNSNYALVINTYKEVSTATEDKGTVYYYAKLMLTNGTTKAFKMHADEWSKAENEKGKLVQYSKYDEDTVSLEEIKYQDPTYYEIHKDERKVSDSYVTDNIKIFDIVSNPAADEDKSNDNEDVVANLVSWSSLPSGPVEPGKIKYINKVGDFGDISVMVLDDLLQADSRLAVVKDYSASVVNKVYTYKYTLQIDNKEYTYNTLIPGAGQGSVVKVKIANNTVYGSYGVVEPAAYNITVEAFDNKRIKINGTVYEIKDNASMYKFWSKGVYNVIGARHIATKQSYERVNIYLDKPFNYGGKVELIIMD